MEIGSQKKSIIHHISFFSHIAKNVRSFKSSMNVAIRYRTTPAVCF